METNDYLKVNRGLWDGWTRIHERSAFYDVGGFKAGQCTLKPVELQEIGDVSGLRLLHLQCHFGLDTLSWARRGARVTGVDFSPAAIDLASSLAAELGLPAEFLCANILELDAEPGGPLGGPFDLVFTSYGVLPWLSDLDAWARLIACQLRPGGAFHIVEFHPLASTLDDAGRTHVFPYLGDGTAIHCPVEGSYAAPAADFAHDSYEWCHGLGEIVTALAAAGLRLDFLHEFNYTVYKLYPFTEEREPGRFYHRNPELGIPLMFSLRAIKARSS